VGNERWPWLRWAFLLTAVVIVVVYLLAQRQTAADISYGQSPAGEDTVNPGESSEVTLPSVADMTEMVRRDKVVRLPGAVAHWDEQRVEAAVGDADIRILVAPPGLSDEQEDQVREVENATIRIMGTEIIGSFYEVVPSDVATWRTTFVTGDVTSLLLSLVAEEKDEPDPPDYDLFSWRAPTAAELDPVANDLRQNRLHVAAGATLTGLPDSAGTAFDGQRPLVAAFPRLPIGQPTPGYGPALAKLFPNTPIVVMYGNWVAYYGPHAGEFADIAGASFYARFGELLARYDYPQDDVLGTYLNVVTDIRYAGLFDRPLPYQPFDPLRVALPALPWLFCGCVLVFLALSARSVLGPRTRPRTPPGRLAGLTTLAIELSALSHAPALTRALGKLEAARTALAEDLPDRHVSRLLTDAQRDLDTVARELKRPDYRPANYLAGVLS
jgi:hypothetical protein